MSTTVEVFAEITCPFAYVGLSRVSGHIAELDHPVDVIVRAWPLEWVNDTGLDFAGVETKAEVLVDELGVDLFRGLDAGHWPSSTLPALELEAAAYEVDAATGLAVGLALRTALFEEGIDIGDIAELAKIAAEHGVPMPDAEASERTRRDYDDGLAKGVQGSPHFWVGADDFFCPALDLGRDAEGHLHASFDADGLAQFFARLDA